MAEMVLRRAGKDSTVVSGTSELRRVIAVSVVVSASYYLTSKLGFAFALQPGSISILWMPNAILFAALLLVPRRWWWSVILAAFPAHLASELQSGVPVAMVLSWFVSNSVQALIGAWGVTSLASEPLRFDRVRELMIFLVVGALAAPFFASFLDIAFIKINGWGNASFWESWRIRFLSNVLATLTLVPMAVVWVATPARVIARITLRQYVEAGLLLTGLLLVGFLAFTTNQSTPDRTSLLYWPLPFLLWAAVRFGPHGVSTSLLVVMFLAISGATHGHGPFVGKSAIDDALSIQWFLIVMAIPVMTLAAVIEERRDAEQALLETHEQNQAILRALPDMMFLHTMDGVYLDYYASDSASLLLPPEAFIGKNVRDVLPKELADRAMNCIARLKDGAESQTLEYSLELNGEERHYEARLVSAGEDKALSIVREVSEARKAANSLVQSEKKLLESNQQIRALAGRLITAQESERRRISLLLHDDVSQKIAALGVAISRLKRKFPAADNEIVSELDQFGLHLHDLTTQIRHLSHQLHPDVLEHVGLVTALESHVSDFRHEEGIDVSFKSNVRTQPLALDLSICLYHVAFEALRNISKHSAAKSASISLTEEHDWVSLEVTDTGRGFDVEKAKHGSGIGLISAEERVKLLSGTFEVRSTPQSGTTVVARVPLRGEL
jgi:signal transduction histidine kinase